MHKNNKNLMALLLSLFVMAILVAACGGLGSVSKEQVQEAKEVEESKEEAHEEDGDKAKESMASEGLGGLKIAMLTSGPINDDGWNQTVYDALVALGEAGAEIANTENVAQTDQLDLIRSYGDQGFDVCVDK